MNTAVMFAKATDEWGTPQDCFDALDAEFDFRLDAAAKDHNTKCYAYLGPDHWNPHAQDALKVAWSEIAISGSRAVWLNPPYSQCAAFINKAFAESRKGCTVVALVPSRTDTYWWHTWVWDREKNQPREGVEVRFLKGRLKFGNSTNSAPFPSVVIVFRPVAQEAV